MGCVKARTQGADSKAEELERAQLNYKLHSVDLKLGHRLQGVDVLVQHRRQDFEMRLGLTSFNPSFFWSGGTINYSLNNLFWIPTRQ